MIETHTLRAPWRAVAALLLAALAGGTQAVTQQDVEWTARCKAEGEQGKECVRARDNLTKYAAGCDTAGPQGELCALARKVVETRKWGEARGAASARTGAATAGAATAAAATAAAPMEGGTDKDLQFALHCKVEGAEGERCMKMQKRLDEYAASCKEEGADGQRCHDVRAARGLGK